MKKKTEKVVDRPIKAKRVKVDALSAAKKRKAKEEKTALKACIRRENRMMWASNAEWPVAWRDESVSFKADGWNTKKVKQAFPFIHGFLSHVFTPNKGAAAQGTSNLDTFLQWLALFYGSGLNRRPESGYTLVLLGMPGTGKGLLAEIVTRLVGGYSSCGDNAFYGKQFQKQVAQGPVLVFNDGLSAIRARKVDPSFLFREVHQFAAMMEEPDTLRWPGRFIVALDDGGAEDLALIRGMDPIGKALVLTLNHKPYQGFLPRREITARLEDELHRFAQYLYTAVEVPGPGHPSYDIRFGFKR